MVGSFVLPQKVASIVFQPSDPFAQNISTLTHAKADLLAEKLTYFLQHFYPLQKIIHLGSYYYPFDSLKFDMGVSETKQQKIIMSKHHREGNK